MRNNFIFSDRAVKADLDPVVIGGALPLGDVGHPSGHTYTSQTCTTSPLLYLSVHNSLGLLFGSISELEEKGLLMASATGIPENVDSQAGQTVGEEEPLLGRAGDASQQEGRPLYYNLVIGMCELGLKMREFFLISASF